MTDYEIVIGLEIHVELQTESKIFCGCSTKFGAQPNSQCCPVCLGLPGTLPLLNRKAVEYAVKAGLALNCEINMYSKFDRKNYFYPDLPKAYQITQQELPLCGPGFIKYYMEDKLVKTEIARMHLEEEAGKSVHSGESIIDSKHSSIDYNRAGIPLIEIVTEPDIRSPKQARIFLEQLKLYLQYAGVSNCRMEEGSLRCDANISLRKNSTASYGNKVEIKNLNSFRALERALTYEGERQASLLSAGQQVQQETRAWDERRGVTVAMRSKANAPDYRYFPEPDLPPLELSEAKVQEIRDTLPELPLEKLHRLIEQYELSFYESDFLVNMPTLADVFEQTVSYINESGLVVNWVMGEYNRLAKEYDMVSPRRFAELLRLVHEGVINNNQGKQVLGEMFTTGRDAETIVDARSLRMISDEDELTKIIHSILQANGELFDRLRNGETRLFGFFVGQVMKETQGRANPEIVNELLKTTVQQGRIWETNAE